MSLVTVHTWLDANQIKTFMRDFTIKGVPLADLLPNKKIKFNATKKYIKIPQEFEYVRLTDLDVDLDEIIYGHRDYLVECEDYTEESAEEFITNLTKHLYNVVFTIEDFIKAYQDRIEDFDVREAIDWCIVHYVENHYVG
jgi:hypothetical protein